MEPFVIFLQLMLINIILSGDNAVVIAMASKSLPEHQRKAAVWWGAAGAVVLRIVLAAGVVYLLRIPYIKAIGAILLMYIAIKLLSDDHRPEVRQASTLGAAVWTIVLADLIMSVDNVLAIAAVTRDNFVLLCAGIALSLPLIVWGSHLIMNLLQRYPLFIVIGAGILGYAAGEMFVTEPIITAWFATAHPSFHYVVPLFFTTFLFGFGWWKYRRSRAT